MLKENQAILLNYLEKALGKSKRTARNNYAFVCPNGCHPSKHKLEINLDTHQYSCWICSGDKGGYKGKSLTYLLRQAKAPKQLIDNIKPYCNETYIPEVKNIGKIELPSEYIPLYPYPTDIIGRHALAYIINRGYTEEDIIKYQLGYCEYGDYANRIILPTYDAEGELNYFVARTFDPNNKISYKNPEISKDIIPDEHLINWDLPIILCEGKFDQMAIKRNAIPLLGKTIQPSLMKRLLEKRVQKIYIMLDKDALKRAVKHCETLLAEGKKVYLVELDGKDPSDIGFNNIIKIIHDVTPLTFKHILELKL